MKKFLIAALSLAAVSTGKTQVQIQATMPTVGLVQKSQLWNLVLVNGTTTSIQGRIELVLRDRFSGLELMSASTARFTLTRGALSINASSVNPVQYNYIGVDGTSLYNDLLPAGAYLACYSFSGVIGEKMESLGEECVPFDVEPLSPPMLIFPADSSELEANPTQFSWTPPTPAIMLQQLRYEILMAEIIPGQTAEQALQQNPSFYNSADIVNNVLVYSSTLPAFEKEKWYAWQVVARDSKGGYAAKTEAWVFRVTRASQMEQIIKGTPYIRMKPNASELGIAPNGILKIAYFNRSTDSTARVVVNNLSQRNDNGKQPPVTVKIVPGENQLQIDLKRIVSLSEEYSYSAEITSASGEKQVALFRVKYFKDK